MSFDSDFKSGLADDISIFDGEATLEVQHNEQDATPDFDTGTVVRSVTKTTVEHCLFRQASLRNGPSVPEMHQRDVGLQKDTFNTVDVVIEVPLLENLVILVNDLLRDPCTEERWRVLDVDYTTLRTRYRLGCCKFT